jgi:ferritin-like protein
VIRSAKFGKGDIGILNYALMLEYLEATFYNEATANQHRNAFLSNPQARVFLQAEAEVRLPW